jgi:HSP20 family protein
MALNSLLPTHRPGRRTSNLVPKRRADHPFARLQDEMNRLFDTFMPAVGRTGRDWTAFPGGDWDFMPEIDVKETKRALQVTAELPGVDEDDLEVRLSNNMLTIRGEKREEKADKEHGWTHTECAYGSFLRSIPLDAEVDADNVTANFKKGVLKVTLPKLKTDTDKSGRIHVKGE